VRILHDWLNGIEIGTKLYVGAQYKNRVLYRTGEYAGSENNILKLATTRKYRHKLANLTWEIPLDIVRLCKIVDTNEIVYADPDRYAQK
jgi:hypothetical protein